MARPAAKLTAHFAPTPVAAAPGSAGREEAIWRPTTSRRLGPTSARQHRLAGKLVLHFVIMGFPLRGTEGSNPAPASGASGANLSSSECRRDGRPRQGLRDPYEEDARADRGDEGDLDQGQAGTSRRVRQLSADDDLAQVVAEAASADNRRRRLPPRRSARDRWS